MTSEFRHPRWPAPVLVRRSPRAQRISLKVDPVQRVATLVLPRRVPQEVGVAFIDDHILWLEERLRALPALVAFLPGASVPLEGVPHLLSAEPGAKRGVWVHENRICVSGPTEFFARRVGDFLKSQARKRIVDIAYPMAEDLGRSIASLRIGDPKTRWGSCSSKGKLAFSWRLVMAPDWVFRYVVAHEVAHLVEMNHSPRFWNQVRKLTPDIDTPRVWLKANGPALYGYG